MPRRGRIDAAAPRAGGERAGGLMRFGMARHADRAGPAACRSCGSRAAAAGVAPRCCGARAGGWGGGLTGGIVRGLEAPAVDRAALIAMRRARAPAAGSAPERDRDARRRHRARRSTSRRAWRPRTSSRRTGSAVAKPTAQRLHPPAPPRSRRASSAFAATAFVQCPLTLDHDALLELLRGPRLRPAPRTAPRSAWGSPPSVGALREQQDAEQGGGAAHRRPEQPRRDRPPDRGRPGAGARHQGVHGARRPRRRRAGAGRRPLLGQRIAAGAHGRRREHRCARSRSAPAGASSAPPIRRR